MGPRVKKIPTSGFWICLIGGFYTMESKKKRKERLRKYKTHPPEHRASGTPEQDSLGNSDY